MATLAVTGRADLGDAQWAVLEPLLPASTGGRPPKWTKRQLINGIPWRAGPVRHGVTCRHSTGLGRRSIACSGVAR